MLARKTYPADYVDTAGAASPNTSTPTVAPPTRRRPEHSTASRRGLLQQPGHGARRFVHRTRGPEGKDGNPLNEVRVTVNSIIHHDGTLTIDKAIKVDPASSVLRLDHGKQIHLNAASFEQLAQAFLDEITLRYPDTQEN